MTGMWQDLPLAFDRFWTRRAPSVTFDRNSRSDTRSPAGLSPCTVWPARATFTQRPSGSVRASFSASSSWKTSLSAPRTTSVGHADAGNRRPQELAPPLGGRRIDAAAVALIVLPHPLAVGHAPQVVEQAAPEQRGVPPRVERERLVHEVLDRVERRGLRREGGDLPRAGLARLRADVDEHEPSQPAAVGARPGERVGAAQRHADQDEAVEPEVVDEGVEVLDVALGARSPSRATTRCRRGRADRGRCSGAPA